MTFDIASATQLGLAVGTMLVVAYNTFQGGRIRNKVRIVASNQEEVKEDLAQSVIATDKKLSVIHALANSAMAQQMKLAATLAQEIAILTGKPEDIRRAQILRTLFDDHMRKQHAADAAEAVIS